MLFAEMTEAVQVAMIGLGVQIVVMLGVVLPVFMTLWFKMQDMKRASDHRAADVKAETVAAAKDVKDSVANVKNEAVAVAKEVKNAVAEVAKKTADDAKANTEAIAGIAESQAEQHKAWNSRLDEYKALIEVAQLAKGVLIGREQLQAEIDAARTNHSGGIGE